jgi:Response regulator receiver domain
MSRDDARVGPGFASSRSAGSCSGQRMGAEPPVLASRLIAHLGRAQIVGTPGRGAPAVSATTAAASIRVRRAAPAPACAAWRTASRPSAGAWASTANPRGEPAWWPRSRYRRSCVVDPLRVVVAEDNYLVREGTRRLLEDVGEVDVVASVGTAEELLDVVARRRPEAVLTDIRMPPGWGTC